MTWTPERRARQAELIRQWQPWEKSTGPKTEAGKAASRRNACKPDSFKRLLREYRAQLRELEQATKGIV